MKKLSFMLIAALAAAACNDEVSVVGNLTINEGFESAYVESRAVRVWTPADYDPSVKYDVIYMHDGQNLFDASITWNHQEWGVDEVLSQMISAGEIRIIHS